MLCPNCGADTPLPATACSNCGTRLPSPFAASPDAETISETMRMEPGTGPLASEQRAARPPGPLAVGEPFGARYRILRELGAGGMGVVYQAWDEDLGVPVAMKVIRTETDNDPNRTRDIERRFKRELLLARQVTHNNVVRIYDLGDINGIKYITMSYVEGADLATIIQREGKLDTPRALRMVRGVVAGLRAAHAAGVVHRDLKPANIMIDEQDEARIMDFGIARSASLPPDAPGAPKPVDLRQHAALVTATMEGGIVGTVEYMAPEQARGEEVDQRADIYALGLIMYDMLGGAGRAARSNSVLGELTARMTQAPPGIRTRNPDVPEALARIIGRCLEPDAKDRYATTRELEADLQRLDDEGKLLPVLRRISTRQIVAAFVMIAILLTGTWWVSRTPVTPPAPEPISVLVAGFENSTGDPVFEGSLEQALAIAMEGSSFITVYPQKPARALALELAPASKGRIDLQTAQLISRREGVKVILAGAIAKRGSAGFRLTLRVIDPADGSQKNSVDRNVAGKADVLPAIASLSERVRRDLGESTEDLGRAAAAETFSAGSIDAMRAYARGQELNYAGKQVDALKAFEEAVALDKGLARAYAGMAVIYGALKRDDKVEEYYKKAFENLNRMSEREKLRTQGGYYLLVTHNYEKAIETYKELVEKFPADDTGHANLALAYLNVRDMPKAVAEGKKAIDIYPKNTLQRTNYAMFSMYSGDYATAILESNEVLKANPSYEYPILTIANSQLGAGDIEGSRQTWARLADVSALGASMASLGRADLAMHFGKHREAIPILTAGIKADEAAGNAGEAAAKYVALAEAYQTTGNQAAAVKTARKAASLRLHESVLFPAAVVLIESGKADDVKFATELAAKLENMLQSQTSSYTRLILGYVALKQKRLGDALEAFRDAQKLHDSWFAHLMLGRVYLEAKRPAEAVAEFEACVKRKGEASDVFFENLSSSRYLPPVYYWLGLAQESLGAAPAAKASYEQFLKLRTESDPADPLATQASQRLKKL
jgi:eukaryotic-like serine/threonine-protein kinase